MGERKGTRKSCDKTALLGKVGTPGEVAEAFVYLMRDSNIMGVSVNSGEGVVLQ